MPMAKGEELSNSGSILPFRLCIPSLHLISAFLAITSSKAVGIAVEDGRSEGRATDTVVEHYGRG